MFETKDSTTLYQIYENLRQAGSDLQNLQVCKTDTMCAKYRSDIRVMMKKTRAKLKIFNHYVQTKRMTSEERRAKWLLS